MAKRLKGIEIKVRETDSEGDRRARFSGFEVLSIRVVVGERHVDKCFYDNSVLKKIGNLCKEGYASYRCPECERAYIMPVSDKEMKKLVVRERGKKIPKGRRYVGKNGKDNKMYLD